MSQHLESLLSREQRNECAANDAAVALGTPILAAQAHRSNFTLTFPRTADEAFRTPSYAGSIVHYTRPSLWRRVWRWITR